MMNLKTVFAFALFASLSANANDTDIQFDTKALHDAISAELSQSMLTIHEELADSKQGPVILLAKKEEAKAEQQAPKAE